jgi:hypothetical protein
VVVPSDIGLAWAMWAWRARGLKSVVAGGMEALGCGSFLVP